MEHDTLARALSLIKNAGVRGKAEVVLKPASRVIRQVLDILQKEAYIKSYEFTEDKRGGALKVQLAAAINNIGAIKPRYPITLSEYEKFEARYLPAKDFGRLIVSTSKGVMTHIDAKEKKLGGTLFAFVY